MESSRQTHETDCERARTEIRAFLSGTNSTGLQSPFLRAHLAACPECSAEYRGMVVGVAAIASGARRAAEDRPETEIAESARRSLIAAETRHRIRLPRSLLPLAVVVLVAMFVLRGNAGTVSLRAVSGTVYRGSELVGPGESIVSKNGDGCSTGVGGFAELARGDDVIRFEAQTSFTVERLDRLAVRLFDGRASVTGTALIVFSSGVLEVTNGSAKVSVDDAGVTLEALAGRVEYTDATRRNLLAPGDTRHFEHVRMAGRD